MATPLCCPRRRGTNWRKIYDGRPERSRLFPHLRQSAKRLTRLRRSHGRSRAPEVIPAPLESFPRLSREPMNTVFVQLLRPQPWVAGTGPAMTVRTGRRLLGLFRKINRFVSWRCASAFFGWKEVEGREASPPSTGSDRILPGDQGRTGRHSPEVRRNVTGFRAYGLSEMIHSAICFNSLSGASGMAGISGKPGQLAGFGLRTSAMISETL
jgi:hypothetical protein